tara:strand:- start:756 stop:1487 length:732 start_codon:yes stop_codon:yes gene_type:complete
MKKAILISVRSGSTRLPQKPYLKINEREIITYLFENIKKSKEADLLVVATTEEKEDSLICDLAEKYGLDYYRGSNNDKLDRWLKACEEFNIDFFVNVDGDDIFFDYELADIVLNQIVNYDFIDGHGLYNDVYGVSLKALNKICINKKTNDTEFIRPFFENDKEINIHKLKNFPEKYIKSDFRMTLDYYDDYLFFKQVIESNQTYTFDEVVSYLNNNPDVKNINYYLDKEWKKNQEAKIAGIEL